MKTIVVTVSLLLSIAISFAQDGKVNFDKAYQRAHAGKASVEIHEVKELVHMAKWRGFIKMKEFGEQLVALRKANKRKKIEDLYPALLQWCAAQ